MHAFVEEKLESFIKNMKEFLSEASVIPSMFKVLEVIARTEGQFFVSRKSWRSLPEQKVSPLYLVSPKGHCQNRRSVLCISCLSQPLYMVILINPSVDELSMVCSKIVSHESDQRES